MQPTAQAVGGVAEMLASERRKKRFFDRAGGHKCRQRYAKATPGASHLYFAMAESCLTVLMNVVVARVSVRSRR